MNLIVMLAICLLAERTIQADLHDNASSSSTQLQDSSTFPGTTDPNDVMGLKALALAFPSKLLGSRFPYFDGDPCYPGELSWIECSNDAVRRVTALNLGDMFLFLSADSSLPDFSSMDALETIDLHDNFLHGPVPEFLGTFPKLIYLNLAGSGLTGPLPVSLSNNKKLKLILSSNPNRCTPLGLCSSPTTPTPSPPFDQDHPTATPSPFDQDHPTATPSPFDQDHPTPTSTEQSPLPLTTPTPTPTPTVASPTHPLSPIPTAESQTPPTAVPTKEPYVPLPPVPRQDPQYPSGSGSGNGGGVSLDLSNVGRRKKKNKFLGIISGVAATIFTALVGTALETLRRLLRRRRTRNAYPAGDHGNT